MYFIYNISQIENIYIFCLRMVNENAVDLKIFCQFSFSLSSGEISSNVKRTSLKSNPPFSQGFPQISPHNQLQTADV